MTQESSGRPDVRWAGDSPNANVNIKNAALLIGYSIKDACKKKRDHLVSNGDDHQNVDFALSSTPPVFRKCPRPVPGDDATLADSTPSKFAGHFRSTTPKSSTDCLLLQRLKLYAERRNSTSPVASVGTVLPMVTPNDATHFDFLKQLLPDTSTPITADPVQLIAVRSQIPTSTRRNRLPFKRHRLQLPDEGPDGAQSSVEPLRAINQGDDDSLIAGLDLDAFMVDARQKQSLVINGTPLKRSKTTGDILTVREIQRIFSKPTAAPEDDDDFFANADVLAEVDVLENAVLTQRLK